MTMPGERPVPSGPAAILIGPPGAGKSTIGPLLAARLGVGFVDTDDRIEAVAGKPVGDIFVEDGEPAFRALEREAVAQAVAGNDGVIGLGGGAVLDPGTQQLLAGRPVVYLATGFATAAKRVGMDVPRPLLMGNPRAQLKALLEQRLPVYEKLALITVVTDGREPDEITADIEAQIAREAPQGGQRRRPAGGREGGWGGGRAMTHGGVWGGSPPEATQ
jgi:shikimate kinase